MYDEFITLVTVQKTVDEYGDTVEKLTRRDVFARLASIGQSEFYQAQAVGFKPEIKFILPDYLEYRGEQRIEYATFGITEPETYTVIRTYRKERELEIVCRKGLEDERSQVGC